MNNKNFYVVALISFFDNDIKQFLIRAENEFVAVKKAMVEFTDDKYKQEEIEFQQSEDYPKEIEDVLNLHPAVKSARVIAKKDLMRGEIVKAEIILIGGSAIDEKEILRHCRIYLSSYKIPREVEFQK